MPKTILPLGSEELEAMPTSSRAAMRAALRRRQQPYRRHRPELDRCAELVPPPLAEAIRQCGTGESAWPLYVHGSVGAGKTRAALFACDWCEGGTAYWELEDLCDTLIDAGKGNYWLLCEHSHRVTVRDIWSEWRSMSLVVLDEIGTRTAATDFRFETLKRCLDGRGDRPAIYLSNIDVDRMRRVYDDRIASRLCAGTVVCLDGPDQRMD